MVGVSPSSSEAVAEQVRVVDVPIPELGLMETEVIVGLVLSTVTDAEPVSVSPLVSVAVAMHRMVSSGELVDVVRVTEAPVPRLLPVLVLVQA